MQFYCRSSYVLQSIYVLSKIRTEMKKGKMGMGQLRWKEHYLREVLEIAAQMSVEYELRMDELGEDE